MTRVPGFIAFGAAPLGRSWSAGILPAFP